MFKPSQLAIFTLSILTSMTIAANPSNKHMVVAPKCLIQKLDITVNPLATQSSLLLIEANDQEVDALIAAKNRHSKTPCGGFIDVTDAWQQKTSNTLTLNQKATLFLKKYAQTPDKALASTHKGYAIRYKATVDKLLQNIEPEVMWSNLAAFSNTSKNQFPDRYANSDTGVKAANWLKNKIDTLAKEHHRTDITSYTVATGKNYKQPSVVVKIGTSNEAGIVIGGHMDTLRSSWELKPGADDDGSGSMTVMEVARTLITSGVQFKKPIYIIWYSAEELGLIGSSFVVKDFTNKKIPVDAVLHFDMTGYAFKNDPTLWLVNDYVNPGLTNYLETLIKTYVKKPVGRTRCGYACSDHASWTQGGFKSAFPFEASFNNDNPYIHSSQDTMDHLSLSHMTDYAKLGLAFAVELAEPITQ